MTAAKSTLRPRRATADSVPKTLAEWFAGKREPGPSSSSVPWAALIYPDCDLLRERWLAWSANHPGVAPPPEYEHLADPTSPRHPSPARVAAAKAMAARAK